MTKKKEKRKIEKKRRKKKKIQNIDEHDECTTRTNRLKHISASHEVITLIRVISINIK